MNYQKLDAAIAVALQDIPDSAAGYLVVFIHTEPALDNKAASFLERLGVREVTSERQMFTATLSASEIKELSEQSWVKYIRLAQKLRLAAPNRIPT